MRKNFTPRFLFIGLLFLLCSANSYAQSGPVSMQAVQFAVSIPVRDMPSMVPVDPKNIHGEIEKNEPNRKIIKHIDPNAKTVPDGALHGMFTNGNTFVTPSAMTVPTVSFEGIGFPGGTCNCAPSDDNGEVGPNHYIQTVNSAYRVWDKVGNPLTGIISYSTLFSALGGPCGTSNDGDPVVIYDQLADRWLISEFCVGPTPKHQLIALSQTANPLGAWYLYDFVMPNNALNDYPHFGMWPDGYYMTDNQFNGPVGAGAFAFDRTKMLVGDPTASYIYFNLNASICPSCGGQLPTDLQGTTLPPTGMGNLFMEFRADEYGDPADGYRIFEFKPNFSTPALSTFVQVGTDLLSAPFDPRDPSGRSDIEQPGTSIGLDAISDRLLAHLNYRNMGTPSVPVNSWVLNHTVNVSGVTPSSQATHQAGIRWAELRRAGAAGAMSINQQGTWAINPGNPAGGTNVWMGSIAQNSRGDIVLGYTTSGSTDPNDFPSIRYAGRLATDPLGFLSQGQTNGQLGTGFQAGGANRWGDYSGMSVDPGNDCLFWYTSEYRIAANNGNGFAWNTRVVGGIGFTTAPCAAAPQIISGTATLISESCAPANGVIDPGETVTVSFCLQNVGSTNTANAVGTLQVSGGVISPSGPQNYGVIVAGGAAVCRNFTFANNSSTCGSTITATIQVQDGAQNLGNITFNFTLGVFSNALLPNGDFETGTLASWTTFASNPPPVVNSTSPHTGTFAAFLGNLPGPEPFGDCSIYQQIVVPATGGILSFWWKGYTEDGITFDWQDAYITNTSNTILATIMHVCTTTGGYVQVTYNLAPFAGQTIRVRFLTHQDAFGDVTNMYVDDVSIQSYTCCGAACTITCPPNQTVNSSAAACGANVTFPTATTTGLCGLVTYTPANGSFFPVGTTIVTASTAAGPSCTFTVTVVDNVPPVITCPANITRNNDPGLCSAVVTYPLPTIRDNCDPAPVQFPASFAAHGGGQVYSLQGNTLPGGLFFTLTNTSASPRTINSFGVRFGDPAFGAVIAPQTLTIWSRPGGLTAAIENSTAGWTAQGPQVVNPIPPYFPTGTGPLGICGMNSAVTIAPGASASFFIHGQTACPIFNYNGSILPPLANSGFTMTGGTISYGQLGTANHFFQGTVNGIANIQVNIAGPIVPILIAGLPSGSVFPVGVTTNTFRATDPVGNSATCSFTVTVIDAQAPTITCPASIVRNTDPGLCTATIAVPNPTNLTDNCAVTTLTWVMTGATTGTSPATGINYVGTKTFNLTGTTGQGITTIVYTAKDAAGNTTTCSFTVTVNDLVLPVITVQPATKFVCVGSNGVFSVTATANGGPIAYQWQTWDGSAWVNIVGATTNSYTVPNVTFADNTRSFRVILTGLCSIVTSSFATLYVNPLPTITLLTSIPPSLLPGQSLNITATGNPPGGTFEWFKDNVLTSHTGSSWNGLTVDDIGVYKVRYTDPNGCVQTSSEIAVTGQPSDKLWVYPNPNNGAFTVRFFNDPNETATVRVFDSKGAKVYEKANLTTTAYTGLAVDLGPTISSGVYVVVVNNSAGKEFGGRKIVVRKK